MANPLEKYKRLSAVLIIAIGCTICACKANARSLFPNGLPTSQWQQFESLGYSKPVCGVVYETGQPLSCGMPLGALGTGCVDVELDGTFGYCSLYNSHVPRRGKMGLPFLGLAVGDKAWVLSTRNIEGVQGADQVKYWGHFPILDLQYETDAPVAVALRAWSPFLPGDEATSNTPGAIFEVHLYNTTDRRQKGSIVLSFPGPTNGESASTEYESRKLAG